MPSLSAPLSSGLGADGAAPVTPAAATLAQPRDWAVDLTTSEIVVVNGDMQLTSGLPSVAQDVQMTCKMYLGEWYDDASKGIDYFGKVFPKTTTDDQRRAIFRTAILGVLGVSRIPALSTQFDNRSRALIINASLQTDIGLLNISTPVTQ